MKEQDRILTLRKRVERRLHETLDDRTKHKISGRLYIAHDALRKAHLDFENKIEEHIRKSAGSWKIISQVLSRFSDDELKKINSVTPSPKYLARYRLLSIREREPQPGDIFLDLNAKDFPQLVLSPYKPKVFDSWKNEKGPKRAGSVAGVSVYGLLKLGKIDQSAFLALDPAAFINECESAMRDRLQHRSIRLPRRIRK